MNILLAILTFIAAIGIHLVADHGKVIDHGKRLRSLIWIALMVPPSIFFYKAAPHPNFWTVPLILAFEFFTYDLVFSGLYNLWRGEDFFFTGSDEGSGDALTDTAWRALAWFAGSFFANFIRVGLAVTFTAIYIIYLLT